MWYFLMIIASAAAAALVVDPQPNGQIVVPNAYEQVGNILAYRHGIFLFGIKSTAHFVGPTAVESYPLFTFADVHGIAFVDNVPYFCDSSKPSPIYSSGTSIVSTTSASGCNALTTTSSGTMLYMQDNDGHIHVYIRDTSSEWTSTTDIALGVDAYPLAENSTFAVENGNAFIGFGDELRAYPSSKLVASDGPMHGAHVFEKNKLCMWLWDPKSSVVCYGVFQTSIQSTDPEQSHTLSKGAIIGIVFGCISFAIIVSIVIANLTVRKRNHNS